MDGEDFRIGRCDEVNTTFNPNQSNFFMRPGYGPQNTDTENLYAKVDKSKKYKNRNRNISNVQSGYEDSVHLKRKNRQMKANQKQNIPLNNRDRRKKLSEYYDSVDLDLDSSKEYHSRGDVKPKASRNTCLQQWRTRALGHKNSSMFHNLTQEELNISGVSIDTDNLRQGLKSIDNPLFKEEVSADECNQSVRDGEMDEGRIKRTVVLVNVPTDVPENVIVNVPSNAPEYYMYQSEQLELRSNLGSPCDVHTFPVYIPQPDYDCPSNQGDINTTVARGNQLQTPYTPPSDITPQHMRYMNKHRKSKVRKVQPVDGGVAQQAGGGGEPDFTTLRSLTEDERYLIYGRFPVKKPKDYRWLSALGCVMNCVIGLIAVSYSIKSEDSFEAGRFTRAKQEGRMACACAILAMFVTVATITIVLLYLYVF